MKTPMTAAGAGGNTFCKHPSKYEKRALNASESEASVGERDQWQSTFIPLN